MTEECEHNRPFWKCEICGNRKLKTCEFCNHWTSETFKCDLSPKDIAPFYSDFTCKDWRLRTK